MARCAVGLLLMAVLLAAAVLLPSVEARAMEARCQASEKIAREISDKIAKRAKPVQQPLIAEKMCKLDRMLPIVIVVVKRGETFEMEYDPYSAEFIYENKHSTDLAPFLCKDLSVAGANEHPKEEESVTPTDNPKRDEELRKVNSIKDIGEVVTMGPQLIVNGVEKGVDKLVKGMKQLIRW